MIVTDFFTALQAGKELANADTWKNAQLRGAKLAVLFGAALPIAQMFGLLNGVTPEQMLVLASAISIVGGMLNGAATVVSTTRIGLSPADSNGVPNRDDGVRDSRIGGDGIRDANPTDTLLDMDYK
jgi:hypothetical protein